jgi:hypothetical protein
MHKEDIRLSGEVFLTIDHLDGKKEERHFKNQILRLGRNAMINVLTNNVSAAFNLYINQMVFGSNGTVGGVPREVLDTQTGLFGPTLITKPVISSINPSLLNQATFTSVILFQDIVGSTINEMALLTADGNFFSMVTSGDLSKTSSMQLVVNWVLSLV